jgi:photosystem II stability/assembly factor-like uncharacterized protein
MRIPAYVALLALFSPVQKASIEITPQQSGSGVRFIAVSAVSPTVAWISGERGTYARTTDGGATWKVAQVPGGERLDFRDVHAFDDKSALLMSAGAGTQSKVYKTTDAGATWKLVFTNPDTAGFYDCMDFFDNDRGLMLGDSFGGFMQMWATNDGGTNWRKIDPARLPPPMPGEGSFASSGTCIQAQRSGYAWGVTTRGRVIYTDNFGFTWSVSTAMPTASDTVGLTSVAFRDNKNGFVFGGHGARPGDTLVYATSDGGKTWTPRKRPPNGAGIWGGAIIVTDGTRTIVTVGPKGSAYSRDSGNSWVQMDTVNYWGLGFVRGRNVGWAVGRGGRITRFSGF